MSGTRRARSNADSTGRRGAGDSDSASRKDEDAPTAAGSASEPAASGQSAVDALERSSQRIAGESTPSDAESEPHLSGTTRYELQRLIGRGGMGLVYLVRDRDLKREVALKEIRHGGAAIRERFVEEAQIVAQLEHPNIAPLYELGRTEGGRPFCTMRYLRGRTLAELLRACRRGDPETCRDYNTARLVQIFLQIARAIDYAHSRGIVHRDLKPANVMLGEHGEVQIIDWGVSKVLRDRHGEESEAAPHAASASDGQPVVTDSRSELTQSGEVVGTPEYLSPEQAASGEVDARADIHALGVILYEMLTLRRPFRSGDMAQLLRAIIQDPPPSPRVMAVDRDVPIELEKACLKALAKRPADRHQTAIELHDEVRAWLESEADRGKRRALADERTADARRMMAELRELEADVARLELEQRSEAERFEDWQPAEEKSGLLEIAAQLERKRQTLARTESQLVATLTAALGFEPGHSAAREALADHYWDRFKAAEASGDARGRDYFAAMVGEYHGGKYELELRGDGSLHLTTAPPGATVSLHPQVPQDFRLVDGEPRALGSTPIQLPTLAMGSYVAVLRKDGYRDVRLPIHIARNQDVSAEVRLFRDDEIGDDFVYVPAGSFIEGGDPHARGRIKPRTETHLDDFFIGRDPITMAEYLEFINDLARLDQARALAHAPRGPEGTYLTRNGDEFALPEIDAEGDRWYPNMPVMVVNAHDAAAYCEWRSQRDGREYCLPTEQEWEKAARGVDGRIYPWGQHFDGSLCNLLTSREDRPGPLPVDAYPDDISVYGVRGMGGNCRDWTSTTLDLGRGAATRRTSILRGGGWATEASWARCASHDSFDSASVLGYLSFRIACVPAGKPPDGGVPRPD